MDVVVDAEVAEDLTVEEETLTRVLQNVLSVGY